MHGDSNAGVCLAAQCCPTLCTPMNCCPPGSSLHVIFQARILEWAAVSYCRGSSQPRDRTRLLCLLDQQADSPPLSHLRSPTLVTCVERTWVLGLTFEIILFQFEPSNVQVTQLCPTLHDPIDGSPPGNSVHGIFQARTLEWVAISISRGSSWPRDWTWVSRIAGRLFTVWATRQAWTR